MQAGVSIEARKDGSSVKVTSGKGIDRVYEWERCKLKSDMGPRKQRWYGSMGIYDPAASSSFSFGGCSGISRTVVQEGQIHFDDMRLAQRWVERHPKGYNTVWTNEGLLVSWSIVAGRQQLSVDVWQMCVNGKRPRYLAGADDSAITVAPTSAGRGIHECVQVDQEVISQTRTQLERNWKKVDEWIAKDKEYRERRQESRK